MSVICEPRVVQDSEGENRDERMLDIMMVKERERCSEQRPMGNEGGRLGAGGA